MRKSAESENDPVSVPCPLSAAAGKYPELQTVLLKYRSRRAKSRLGTARQIVGRRSYSRSLRRTRPLALRQPFPTTDRHDRPMLLPPSRPTAMALHIRRGRADGTRFVVTQEWAFICVL